MYRPLSLLLLLGVIWGSGYSIARFAMTHGVSPLGYAFWQSWGPAIFLILWVKIRHLKVSYRSKAMSYYIFTGVVGIAIPNTAMYFVAGHLPSGLVAILVNTVPLMTYPLSLLLKEEKFYRPRFLGVLVGVIGIMCLLFPRNGLSGEVSFAWALLCLIAPLCFSLCAVMGSRYRPEQVDAVVLSAGMLLVSAICLTPLMWVNHAFFNIFNGWHEAGFAVMLEVVLSSLGYILFFQLLKVAGPVYYSLVGGVVALTGLFWGRVVFNEQLSGFSILAIVLIWAAIFWVTLTRKPII